METVSGLSMLRQWLVDPSVASVKPTSPYLIRRICDRLSLGGRRVVVELGPGLGCFSRALLDRLSPDSTLVAVERNPDFASRLRGLRDPRLRVVHGSADHVMVILHRLGIPKADVVLSGIPFSHFSESRTVRLLADLRAVLAPDGAFVTYQCSARLEKPLKQIFGSVKLQRHVFHIPPLVVLEARAG